MYVNLCPLLRSGGEVTPASATCIRLNMNLRNLRKAALVTAATAIATHRVVRELRKVDFRNKVVAITGGSRGLGLAIAEEFLRRGARVAFCGRDTETLQKALQLLLERTGQHAQAMQCDVTNELEARGFVAHVEAELGPIDVLVNNA